MAVAGSPTTAAAVNLVGDALGVRHADQDVLSVSNYSLRYVLTVLQSIVSKLVFTVEEIRDEEGNNEMKVNERWTLNYESRNIVSMSLDNVPWECSKSVTASQPRHVNIQTVSEHLSLFSVQSTLMFLLNMYTVIVNEITKNQGHKYCNTLLYFSLYCN